MKLTKKKKLETKLKHKINIRNQKKKLQPTFIYVRTKPYLEKTTI